VIPLRDVIPSRTYPLVTVGLIAINTLVFLFQLLLDEGAGRVFVYTFGLVPQHFSAFTVVTSMFLHGGIAHFTGNMLYLWIFGDNVEDRMGHLRFVVFYLLCGTAAALAQAWADPASEVPMVGASGAIAGVMGAYIVLYPHSRVLTLLPFPIMVFEVPAVVLLGLWFALQFLSGLGSLASVARGDAPVGGIAFWAHVAGFAAGAVAVFLFRRPERQRVEWWDTTTSG
jgi:membrane associated rhomboid family serine protease